MSAPAWMPFYPADYLAGTGHLTRAQHGAYLLLILHYWSKGGLPSDDRLLARIARMSDREWKAESGILAEFFDDGWHHPRIEKELEKARTKSEKRAEAGARGGDAKSLKNNGGDVAIATVLLEQKDDFAVASSSEPEKEKKEKKEPPSPPSVVRPPQKSRGEFLPQEWGPCLEGRRMAIAELGSREAALRELEKFRNYWFAKSGADGRKRDWDATWRNWIMRAADDGKRNGNHQRQHRPSGGADNILAAMDELFGGGSDGGGGAPSLAGFDDAERDAAGVYRIPH